MKTATSNVNFKLDTDVKESMEDACKAMGLTLTAAFTIFAKKLGLNDGSPSKWRRQCPITRALYIEIRHPTAQDSSIPLA